MSKESTNKQSERMIAGAKAYAAADKSDPFAFNRAMSHLAYGVSGLDLAGNDAFYKADQYTEERHLPEGERFNDGTVSWAVPAYRNIQRP